MEWIEAFPLALITLLVGAFTLYLASYSLSKVRPPTDEPVIGHFRFFLKGTGAVIEGLTTTARQEVSDAVFYQVTKQGGNKKEESETDRGLTDEKRTFLQSLFYYAVRSHKRKTLVISDRNIESGTYSDGEVGGRRFSFPFGWISYRNVYGYGSLYPRRVGRWDQVVTVYPENLRTGKHDLTTYTKMMELGEAVALLHPAAIASEEARYLRRALNAKDIRLKETYDYLAEASDKADLAERRSRLRSPFSTEAPSQETTVSWIPKLTFLRIIVIAVSGVVAYRVLPDYSTLHPNNALIIGLIAGYAFWIIYDNYLKHRVSVRWW